MATAEWDEYRAAQALSYARSVRRKFSAFNTANRLLGEAIRKAQPGGVSYEGRDMPGSPNVYGDAVPDAVVDIESAREQLELRRADREAAKSEFWAVMFSMEHIEYGELVWKRHIDYDEEEKQLTWFSVADSMNKSESWCKQHERAALVELYEFMPHTEREAMQPAV